MTNSLKIKGFLAGIDSNAFALMAHFTKLAERQGVSKKDIDDILDEAMKDDYNHLLRTLDSHME